MTRPPGGALLLLLASLLGACGGGVGSGGTGSPVGAASVSGVVTGLGSVYVDGRRFDDDGALIATEVAPGVLANATLALGQTVALQVADADAAAAVYVEPRVVGPVQSVDGDGRRLRVLGQTVQLNDDDAAAGPGTVFGAAVRAGDIVEVHGYTLGNVLQATRIEPATQPGRQWRVDGRIAQLRGGAGRLRLGALEVDIAGADVVPEGASLADGQAVTVFGRAGGADTLVATQLRVHAPAHAAAVDAQLAGSVESLDGSTFVLDGVRIDSAGAELRPANRALANGQYVRVRGTYRDSGVLAATRIDIRERVDAAPPVTMDGTLYVDAGGVGTLRDTRVVLRGARLQGCGNAGLTDGRFVELRGRIEGSDVVAETVRCRPEPGDAVVERRGVAGPLERSGNHATFTLTQDSGASVRVRIDRRTNLRGLDESTLAGRAVRVEGRLRGGTLHASTVAPAS